jgi:hypothetical protein
MPLKPPGQSTRGAQDTRCCTGRSHPKQLRILNTERAVLAEIHVCIGVIRPKPVLHRDLAQTVPVHPYELHQGASDADKGSNGAKQ